MTSLDLDAIRATAQRVANYPHSADDNQLAKDALALTDEVERCRTRHRRAEIAVDIQGLPAVQDLIAAANAEIERLRLELAHAQPSPHRWLHSCNLPGASVVATQVPATCPACSRSDGTWSTFVEA